MKLKRDILVAVAIIVVAGCAGNGGSGATSPLSKIYFISDRDTPGTGAQIFSMPANGSRATRLTVNGFADFGPAVNRDASLIAFAEHEGLHNRIVTMNPDGSNVTVLTDNTSEDDMEPCFAIDEARIIFTSNRTGADQIFIMGVDGLGPTRIVATASNDSAPCVKPDDLSIAFQTDRDGHSQVYVMDIAGQNPLNLSNSGSNDYTPRYSPDGNTIVFVSDRDGGLDIYKMDQDGSNQARLTTDSGDTQPCFTRDGQHILFMNSASGNKDVYEMDLNGGNRRRLTQSSGQDSDATVAYP